MSNVPHVSCPLLRGTPFSPRVSVGRVSPHLPRIVSRPMRPLSPPLCNSPCLCTILSSPFPAISRPSVRSPLPSPTSPAAVAVTSAVRHMLRLRALSLVQRGRHRVSSCSCARGRHVRPSAARLSVSLPSSVSALSRALLYVCVAHRCVHPPYVLPSRRLVSSISSRLIASPRCACSHVVLSPARNRRGPLETSDRVPRYCASVRLAITARRVSVCPSACCRY